MFTHTWTVNNLRRESETGRVTEASWQLVSTDETNTTRRYGSVSFPLDSSVTIPFENLTEEIVLGWVKESLGEAEMEALQVSSLEAKATEPVQGMPW